MEELISKWIRETISEFEKAKSNQNYYKMKELRRLYHALLVLKDNLLNSRD